ncbi:MAG: hypothetical protein H0U63_02295 [Burkholderiales bacterium]|nr:hypothetical protein [Burkholderiales bacterium]
MTLLKTLFSAMLMVVSAAAFAAKGEYGDMCVTGLSMGKEVPTDCSVNMVMDGKTLCFSGEKAKEMFMKDQKAMLMKADENFVTMKKK